MKLESEIIDRTNYEKFFSMSMDLFCIMNAEGKILVSNPRFKSVIKQGKQENTIHFQDHIHPDDRAISMLKIKSVAERTEFSGEVSNRIYGTDGEYHKFIWKLEFDAGSGLLYACGKDITDIVAAGKLVLDSDKKSTYLLEHAPDSTLLLSKTGKIMFANTKAECMFGYTKLEFIALNIYDLIYCKSRHKDLKIDVDLLDEIWSHNIDEYCEEVEARTKNGKIFPASVNFNPADSMRQKKEVFAVCSIRDITNNKITEKALNISEQRYTALFEQINEGILVLSRESKVQLVNPFLTNLLGYQKEELIGMSLEELLFNKEEKRLFNFFLDDSVRKNPESFKIKIKRKGLGYLWVKVSSSPIFQEQDQYGAAMFVISDITQQVMAEKIMEASYNELKFLDKVNQAALEIQPVCKILEIILESCGILFSASNGKCYLYDENNNRFSFVNNWSPEWVKRELDMADGQLKYLVPYFKESRFVTQALESKKMLILRDLQSIVQATSEFYRHQDVNARNFGIPIEQVKTLVIIPLVSENDFYGIIIFGVPEILPEYTTQKIDRFINGATTALALTSGQKKLKELAEIVKQSNEAIFSTDNKGRIVTWNKSAEHLLGYTYREIMGTSYQIFIQEDNLRRVTNFVKAIKQGNGQHSLEITAINRNGSPVDIAMDVFLINNTEGEWKGFSFFLRDLSYRKMAEKERQSFYNVFDQSLNEIYLIGLKSSRFIYANKTAFENLAYTQIELLARTPTDVMPEFKSVHYKQAVEELTQGATKIKVFHTTHKRKDGTTYPVLVNLQLAVFRQKPVLIAIVVDITNQVEATRKIEASYNELKLIDRINKLSMNNSNLEQLAFQVLNTYEEVVPIVGSRLYFYNEKSEELRLIEESLSHDFGNFLRKKLSVDSKKVVPELTQGSSFMKVIKKREMMIVNSKQEIIHIFKEHTSSKALRTIVRWVQYMSGIKTFILIPLINKDNLFGIITLASTEVLYKEQIDRIKRFTNGVTSALIKASTEGELQRLAAIVSHSNDAILSVENGIVVSWNSAAERLLGYSRSEILGTSVSKLGPKHLLEEHKEIINRVQKGESIESYETEQVIKGGGILFVSMSIFPILDEEKNVIGISSIIRDITSQKETEKLLEGFTIQLEKKVKERTEELKRSKEELKLALEKEKELSHLKSMFVSTASHQFRTPMAVIQTNSELLSMLVSESNEAIKDSLEDSTRVIIEEVNRMTMLMDEVLTLGKISSQSINVLLDPLDIIVFCKQLIDQLNSIQKDGRQIEWIVEGPGHVLMLDKKLIHHALANLLNNALKYSVGRPNPEVTYRVEKKEVVISIKDFGIGIPPENVENLFQAFYRADNTRDIDGTGLGLSIAQEYLKLNEGRITVDSKLNEWTEFKVFLPLRINQFTRY